MEGWTDRERQTDRQADTHTLANIPLLKFVVRYKLNMKFLERFTKYPQNHPGKHFFAEIQLDSEPEFMNTIAKLHNRGKFLNYFSKLEKICEMAVYLHRITFCQFKTATDAVH